MRIPAIPIPAFPGTAVSPSRAPRIRRACALLLTLLYPALESRAASPFLPEGRIDAEQFVLPWDGPGAAIFNPALITETGHADGRYGLLTSASGKGGLSLFQGSFSVPFGISAGFNRFENGTGIDGSNAVYEEAINTSMIGWGRRDIRGSGYDGGIGLAYVRHDYNAFGAVRSQAHAVDIGIHAATPALGRAGRIHAGLTVRNLAADEVKLPDDNPSLVSSGYKALLLNIDASVLVNSAFDCLDAFLELNAHVSPDPAEGPSRDGPSTIKSMGLEYRPMPYAGLKIERTWMRRWTAGAVAEITLPIGEGLKLGVETDFSHDKILTPKDEGRGFIWSLALNAGM
jgi:hypothetical protein